jgi:hypothetical protein
MAAVPRNGAASSILSQGAQGGWAFWEAGPSGRLGLLGGWAFREAGVIPSLDSGTIRATISPVAANAARRAGCASRRACGSAPTSVSLLPMLSLLCLAFQSTWYVDAAAPAPGQGTVASPYSSVAYALAQPTTVGGDTVLVAPGVYLDEAVDFLGKDVVVRGTGGAAVTRLEAPAAGTVASAPVVTFDSGETSAATLEGLTIVGRGGALNTVAPYGPIPSGGGLSIIGASPTLRDLVVTGGEQTNLGGGALVQLGAPLFVRCRFELCGPQSFAHVGGGGVAAFDSNLTLEQCEFVSCSTSGNGGGALLVRSTTTMTGCDVRQCSTLPGGGGAGIAVSGGQLSFTSGRIRGNLSSAPGGGLRALDGATVDVANAEILDNSTGFDIYPGGGAAVQGGTFRRTVFRGNVGQYGGGLYATGTVLVEGCTFEANTAYGGLYASGGGGLSASAQAIVRHTIFRGNLANDMFSSGGAAVYGAGVLDQCTVVGNLGTGNAAVRAVTALSNSIVRGNTPTELAGVATVTYSNVAGGAAGNGNFDLEPLFHAPLQDLHLLPGSPCIDSGDPMAPLDSDGTRADVGALTFDPFHCGPSCTGAVGTTTCNAAPNSTGLGARLTGLGSAAAAADLLILTVEDIPSPAVGYFLASRQPGSMPLGGGSQGVLCLGGTTLRFSADVVSDRGTGVVAYRPRLGAFPQGNVVQPGDTWHFQFWFRDANPTPTSNTSAALRVDFQ